MHDYPRPLDSEVLNTMAGYVGAAAYEMAEGDARWVQGGDILPGRASMLAARALIEFLVGRPTGRHRGDIWPSDFHPTWHVKEGDTKLLRERLAYIDPWLAHLSLKRAGTAPPWPERWHDTVLRVLRLTRRFADEISEHPAYHRLCVPIDNVEALLR